MSYPISSIASFLFLFLIIAFCLSGAITFASHIQHAGAGSISIPRIVQPFPGASMKNEKIQVLVTGRDVWAGGPLLLVLDHGVQALDVPLSGAVDLGIVAAGRSVVMFCSMRHLFFV